MKKDFRYLEFTPLLLGASCILDGVGKMLGLKTLAEIGLHLYLVLAIVWAAWIGGLIYRGRV